jgi:hypothetical protein
MYASGVCMDKMLTSHHYIKAVNRALLNYHSCGFDHGAVVFPIVRLAWMTSVGVRKNRQDVFTR